MPHRKPHPTFLQEALTVKKKEKKLSEVSGAIRRTVADLQKHSLEDLERYAKPRTSQRSFVSSTSGATLRRARAV